MIEPQEFEPSAALSLLMAEVTSLVTQHSSTGWGVAVTPHSLLPLGPATPEGLTYGLGHMSMADRARLASTAIPDACVCAAAELADAAPRNLERLVQALDSRGFVSIADADRFCAVELANEQEAARPVSLEARHYGRARKVRAALTQRLAARGCAGATAPGCVKLVGSAPGPVIDVWAGVPSLAADRAAWLGSGLGVAAGLFHPSRFDATT